MQNFDPYDPEKQIPSVFRPRQDAIFITRNPNTLYRIPDFYPHHVLAPALTFGPDTVLWVSPQNRSRHKKVTNLKTKSPSQKRWEDDARKLGIEPNQLQYELRSFNSGGEEPCVVY